jgi:hypothetical protein
MAVQTWLVHRPLWGFKLCSHAESPAPFCAASTAVWSSNQWLAFSLVVVFTSFRACRSKHHRVRNDAALAYGRPGSRQQERHLLPRGGCDDIWTLAISLTFSLC